MDRYPNTEKLPPLEEFATIQDRVNSSIPTEEEFRKLISIKSRTHPTQKEFEQASLRLRERLSHIPWYQQREKVQGMSFWHGLHASSILSDEIVVTGPMPIPENPEDRT